MQTKPHTLTKIDHSQAGKVRAIAAVEFIPENPAAARPDPLLWLLPSVLAVGMVVVFGAIALPRITSAKVQSLEAQTQQSQAEITRIRKCVGGI